MLFSDVPGDAEKVRAILAQWGVEESSIRRLMGERRTGAASGDREATSAEGREPQPRKYAQLSGAARLGGGKPPS
jgi:hypothetical protein